MNNQGKVWGFTSHLFAKNNVSIHRIQVDPGGYCSKHKHNHKYNMFYVEEGALDIEVWKNDYDLVDKTVLVKGDFMSVKPGEYHLFKANKDTIAFEIYWPELLSEDIQRKSVGKMNK